MRSTPKITRNRFALALAAVTVTLAATVGAGPTVVTATEPAAGTNAAETVAPSEAPCVRVNTEAGSFIAVLQPALAPHHVAQFLHLARTGFYAGTKFHRIAPGFVIQGGDPNSRDDDPANDGLGGPTFADVLAPEEAALVERVNEMLAAKGYVNLGDSANLVAEFSRDAKHLRGTLSMARAPDPDSAGSQFFVCVADIPHLDGQYTIFGRVIQGMEVVDSIVAAEVDPNASQRPLNPVAILSVDAFASPRELPPDAQAAYRELILNEQ